MFDQTDVALAIDRCRLLLIAPALSNRVSGCSHNLEPCMAISLSNSLRSHPNARWVYTNEAN